MMRWRGWLAMTVIALTGTAAPGPPNQVVFQALRGGEWAKAESAITVENVNSRDEYGNTPLMFAAVYAPIRVMEAMIAQGADINAATNTGHTALMRAMPDLAKIQMLVEHGANVKATTVTGRTPLMLAARIPSASDVVRYLLKMGADVDARDRGDSDAVMVAAAAGAATNLRLLLGAGAKGVRGRARDLILTDRAGDLNQAVVDRARRAAQGSTALMGAASANCEECVRTLLAAGADVKAKTASGMTALHSAAYEGNASMVARLLNAGAPVNVADERGLTPLMMAANSRSRNPRVVELLIERGADAEAKDADGRRVSDWARIGADPEIMRMVPTMAVIQKAAMTAEAAAPKDIRARVQTSISLMDSVAPNFFAKTGCISCHSVSIPMLALAEARERGYAVNVAAGPLMVKYTLAALAPHRDNLLSGYCSVPGMSTTTTYAEMSLQSEGRAANVLTDGIARCLIVDQRKDGSWRVGDTRPPLSTDGIAGTALSAWALRMYPVPALAAQDRRKRRSRERVHVFRAAGVRRRLCVPAARPVLDGSPGHRTRGCGAGPGCAAA